MGAPETTLNLHGTAVADFEASLRARFGDLLTLADVAQVLRYPSLQAAQKARLRGALPIPMKRIDGRRGWYATARAVAVFLEKFEGLPPQNQPEVGPMR